MLRSTIGILRPYAVATGLVALAMLVWVALTPFLGDGSPYLVFVLPVLVLAWRSGVGTALFATILSGGAALYWFVTFTSPRQVIDGRTLSNLLFFFAVSLGIAYLAERAKATERARQAGYRVRDDLIAVVSHELRNPLSAISTGLGLMRARPGRTTGIRTRERVEAQVHIVTRMIEDLIDATRLRRGTLSLDKRPTAVADVLRGAAAAVAAAAAARDHRINIDVGAEPFVVDADASRLQQVFANLLGNAIKYTTQGGQISVSVSRPGNLVRVSVKDSGIGFAAEDADRIFEPFERGTQTTADGLGIGLFVARSVVATHGGTLIAQSEGIGCGSEFIVELPVICEQAAVETRQTAETSAPSEAHLARR
jgi:signal transduction histidine kinase